MHSNRQAVILAAGEGKRLAQASGDLPKPLVPLAGRPILAHTLQRLEQAGLAHAFVVLGFQPEKIEDFLDHFKTSLAITTVRNPDYRRENGSSLRCVEVFLRDRFLLTMADHIVSPEIYRSASSAKALGLCVDHTPTLACQKKDATRVRVQDKKIVQIGKELTEWNATDTGVFSLTPVIFEALEALSRQEQKMTITQAMRYLIDSQHPLEARDVSGKFWADIDTPEDLREVERCLKS